MIRRIVRLQRRLAQGKPEISVPLQLVHARVDDVPVTFCVNKDNDPIQKRHRQGRFYEEVELRALAQVFPRGGTFVDIGANVGNHTLFAAMHLGAARVIPFEPNPLAFELLVQNVLVNRLQDIIDISRIGVGLSDSRGEGFAMQERDFNLGAARMLPGEGGLDVHRADALLAEDTPDFIKIDVEGMEMPVLAGLSGVLDRCRPIMMVEVENVVEEDFHAWVAEVGYGIVATHVRYRTNKNYLIADAGDVARLRDALAGPGLAAVEEASS